MTTLYLRFPDSSTFTSLLPDTFVPYGETGSPLPEGIEAISIVGSVYTGGAYDEEGNVLTPPVQIAGWHVNALGTLPDSWKPYEVFPTTPQRTF